MKANCPVLVLMLFAASRVAFASPPTTQTATLDLLRPLVGAELRIDTRWADGSPLTARAVWSWAVPNAFIECKTFVPTDGGEYQPYDNLFSLGEGGIANFDFVYDGSWKSITMTVDGKKLLSESADDGSTLQQSIEIAADGSSYVWKAFIRRPGETERKPLIEGVWVRQKIVTPFGELKTLGVQPTTNSAVLDMLSDLIGQWTVSTKTIDGVAIDATAKFEWGIGRKFVYNTTLLSENAGPPQPAFTVYGVTDGKLWSKRFLSTRTVETLQQTVIGKRLVATSKANRAGHRGQLSQSLEELDPSSLRWKVWQDANEGRPIFDAIRLKEK